MTLEIPGENVDGTEPTTNNGRADRLNAVRPPRWQRGKHLPTGTGTRQDDRMNFGLGDLCKFPDLPERAFDVRYIRRRSPACGATHRRVQSIAVKFGAVESRGTIVGAWLPPYRPSY